LAGSRVCCSSWPRSPSSVDALQRKGRASARPFFSCARHGAQRRGWRCQPWSESETGSEQSRSNLFRRMGSRNRASLLLRTRLPFPGFREHSQRKASSRFTHASQHMQQRLRMGEDRTGRVAFRAPVREARALALRAPALLPSLTFPLDSFRRAVRRVAVTRDITRNGRYTE